MAAESTAQKFGLSCAISTPFAADGSIDVPKLIAHAKVCRSEGCGSITLFGTTGEGFSIGPKERAGIYAAFAGAGFDMRREVGAGIMAASVEEAAAQAKQALNAGCRHLLLAPPFYLKGITDDGVYAWHKALFETLGSACRGVILYNLPGQTAVTISHDVVARLRKAFPALIIGLKDSSGQWGYTERMLAEHKDIAILIGDERHLARAVKLGGQGSICGMANAYATRLKPLVDDGREDPIINQLVEAVIKRPVLPSVKALIAARNNDPAWNTVRAPLVPLSDADRTGLVEECRRIAGA